MEDHFQNSISLSVPQQGSKELTDRTIIIEPIKNHFSVGPPESLQKNPISLSVPPQASNELIDKTIITGISGANILTV